MKRTRNRRTLSKRKSYKRRHTIRRSTRQRTRQRRRRSKHTMRGGNNGLSQILLNSYRFTKNSALNMFNKLEGNSLVPSSSPTNNSP